MKFSNKQSSRRSSRSGQSIIEAIVAISILTTGFLGITTLLTKSFQLNRDATDQTKATYLASEGVEVAKSLIDHDVYAGLGSNGTVGGWGSCFNFTGSFYVKVDYETTDCSQLDLSASEKSYPIYFNIDPSTGLEAYSYTNQGGTGASTIFARDTLVTVSADGNEIDVQSTVYWSPEPLASDKVTLEDHFYNWYPKNTSST